MTHLAAPLIRLALPSKHDMLQNKTIESPSQKLNFGGTCYEMIVKYEGVQDKSQA
jgi:hypothetical protein